MADQISVPLLRAVDRNATPQPGAKLYTYTSQTMTALVVTDEAGTPLAWPVVADKNGLFPQIFYAGSDDVKVIVTDADDVILPGYPVDPCIRVPAVATQAGSIAFSATANVPETDVQAAIEFVGNRAADLAEAAITDSGLANVTGTLEVGLNIGVTAASQTQAESGAANNVSMTPLRTAQAIAAQVPILEEYESGEQTITSAGALTLSHGLGARPKIVQYSLVCIEDEAGYTAGEVIAVDFGATSTSDNRVNTAKLGTSAINVRFSNQTACFIAGHATTGLATGLTNSKWKLVVRAWA